MILLLARIGVLEREYKTRLPVIQGAVPYSLLELVLELDMDAHRVPAGPCQKWRRCV
jgi:hypothetical protein